MSAYTDSELERCKQTTTKTYINNVMVVRHIKKKRNIGNVYSYDERFWIAGQNYKFDEVTI